MHGADWYKSFGTEKSPGTKIFTLSGDIGNPGHYEVDMGIKLEDLINKFGGGVKGSKTIKAVLLGGAAGTFASSKHLTTPLDFDFLKDQGLTLGSGAVMVMNENRSIINMLISTLDFFKHESCGKCIPCRIGTVQILNALHEINGKSPKEREAVFINIVNQAEMMAKTSLCPLGQSPILPLRSAWTNFSDELINQ